MLLNYELVMRELDTVEYRERLSLVLANLKNNIKNKNVIISGAEKLSFLTMPGKHFYSLLLYCPLLYRVGLVGNFLLWILHLAI